MTASDSHIIEEEFVEAKNSWELEKLYVDLASAKGKALTPVEKKFLRGLLCGFSPAEIANTVYKTRSSSTVRVYLSNGLYKYIEEMLSNQSGTSIKVKNWSRVTQLLEKAGYKKNWVFTEATTNRVMTRKNEAPAEVKIDSVQQDWGEATDVSVFYGRSHEIEQIQNWVTQERCRLIVILGMAGVGKTTLSVKLAHLLQHDFDFVIWRSLQSEPPLEVILYQLIKFLSSNPDVEIADTVEGRISQIIECMRSARCLIVLDGIDAILVGNTHQKNEPAKDTLISDIQYQPGYEGYGELIRRSGESQHHSCVLLTSREKPQAIAALSGDTLPVKTLKLTGLSYADSLSILKAKGLTDLHEEESTSLIDWYAGNPLFLKLVATAIQELFNGSVYEFLQQGTVVFGEIRRVLDEQFERLSPLEKQVMYWLALNQDFLSVRKLQRDILPRVSQRLILEAIELLQRRSLIERRSTSLSQAAVLIEYIAERLIEENMRSGNTDSTSLLINHPIFETQLKNYIRERRFNPGI
ncbi:MAG: NACHT domain-containing protein [Calothrix sp. C42_A2020_038]|nr:NACHT domain-containing protein [Calothrix sp. C42_A2020_038]